MSSRKRVTNVQLRRVHRYLGLAAAIWLLLLSITGIAMNHSNQLNLDQRFLDSPFLLQLYGVKSPKVQIQIPVSGSDVSQLNHRVYLDQKLIAGSFEPLIGAVRVDAYIVLATPRLLTLVTTDCQIVDQLAVSEFSDNNLTRAGRGENGQLAVETSDGVLTSDLQFLTWAITAEKVLWSEPGPIPKDQLNDLMRLYQGREISVERLLLDLHSGRFFGIATIIVMDFVGVLLLLVATTGVWIWWRSQPRNPKGKRR